MTEAELKKMTVKQLRDLASEKTDLTGLSGMKKADLLEVLMKKLDIEKSEKGEVRGKGVKQGGKKVFADKHSARDEIRRLKMKKEKLLQSGGGNPQQLRNIRRRVRSIKRSIRKVP